jgi:hypothetical protein
MIFTGMEPIRSKAVHQLSIDFKKACDSVRKGLLYMYNILIEFSAD